MPFTTNATSIFQPITVYCRITGSSFMMLARQSSSACNTSVGLPRERWPALGEVACS